MHKRQNLTITMMRTCSLDPLSKEVHWLLLSCTAEFRIKALNNVHQMCWSTMLLFVALPPYPCMQCCTMIRI